MSHAELVGTLRWLRDELEADVRARGAVVDGRPNPALEPLRRIVGDLARMAPAEAEEEPEDDFADLHRAIRAVDS